MPCALDTDIGLCSDGRFPVFNPTTLQIECGDEGAMGECQRSINNDLGAAQSYLSNVQSCCVAPGKSKRTTPHNLLSRVRSSFDSRLNRRAAYCAEPGEDPRNPPQGTCFATYTCDHIRFPNVCGNAKSAISLRGKTSILTHRAGNRKHYVGPW